MADAKEEAKPAAAPAADAKKDGKGKGGGKAKFILFMIMFGFAVPFIMPTLILVLVGMIPTIIALVTDSDRNKSSTAAIGAMNCAGLTPFIIDLWVKGQSMPAVLDILRVPGNWLVILGASAIGQLIVFAVPQAMTALTLVRAEIRLKTLKHNLEQLKTTWGPEVATTKPLDKIVKE
ncbi:MAG TPA: hypothetical protein VFR09_00665 [Alphaproteobacteria bacterium]|nr:hypothetical protein [Alphaproteobacteria bacterium]